MVISQTELKSEVIELSAKAFETFFKDISDMFSVKLECAQQEVSEGTIDDIKKRFGGLVAVNIVKAEGVLDGIFHLIFDQEGLSTLAGVVIMLPEEQILENRKNNSVEYTQELSDTIAEAGNLLVGAWDRVFRENIEGHGDFARTNSFIGEPWDEPGAKIGLSENTEFVLVSYAMTLGSSPACNCGVIFPKVLLGEATETDTQLASPEQETTTEEQPSAEQQTPVEQETANEEEPSAEQQTPVEEESPSEEEASAEEQPPVEAETVNEEEPSAEQQTPVEEESPSEEEPSAEEQTPVEQETANEEEPSAEQQPPVEQETATEEEPSAEQQPPVEQETAAEEEPSAEQQPPVEQEAVTEEEPSAEEQTPVEENTAPEEASAEQDAPVEQETANEEEPSAEQQPPVEQETSTEEEPSAEQQPPVEENTPPEEKPSAEQDAPVEQEAVTEEEPSAEEQTPVEENTAPEEASAEQDAPVEQETTTEEQPSAEQQPPVEQETVTEEQASAEEETSAEKAEDETTVTEQSKEPAGGEISETIQRMTQSQPELPNEDTPATMAENQQFSTAGISPAACAKDIMQKEVVWGSADDSVQRALTKMQQADSGYMMIGEDGAPEGIVSKSDITGAISPYLRPIFAKWHRPLDDATLQIKVKWIMSRPVHTVKPETSLVNIMGTMRQSGLRALPVMDQQGNIQGMVTVFDIFKTLISENSEAAVVGKTSQAPPLA